ncbi:zinc ribbon domain-containing protein [Nonomuraea sp. NPDC026600]|uniref:zinc ribbon domain-containing protein n=1 Tax=Nonomuraea sp. NPDC026600 TaxID=3155363 RepID=UPI0033D63F57
MSADENVSCESCGMPMNSAEDHAPGHPESTWCRLCSKPDGALQDFDERFERMVQWQTQRTGRPRAEAEEATRAYMRTMPAWRGHPRLVP